MPKLKTKDADPTQVGAIIDIEGIGGKFAKKLEKIGVKTTEDLRKASMVEMSELTDISTKLLYKWQCMADLFRVRRAAEEYSEVLFELGIETVKELSKKEASSLHAEVKEFTEEASKKPGWQGDIRKAPSLKDVEKWITSAKELVE
ncbi:MAG: DUF4332 domain-containing protein [Promethearchaeota archaeon]